MATREHKVEYLVWHDSSPEYGERDIHAVGCVIEESDDEVTLAVTESMNAGYLDTFKIARANVISRSRIDSAAPLIT